MQPQTIAAAAAASEIRQSWGIANNSINLDIRCRFTLATGVV